MRNLMRMTIIPLAMAGLTFAACRETRSGTPTNVPGSPKVSNEVVNAFGIFGGAKVTMAAVILCAGRVPLANGTATVTDSCFTGDTNIVVCTDTTSASPVRCAPGAGALLVGGNSSDVIAYARMR